jgi:hypothetical protein
MFGGTFIFSSDSRFPSHYPIPLHDRVEGGRYEHGGEIGEQESRKKLEELRREKKLDFSIGNHGLVFMSLNNGFKKSYDNYKEAYEHYLKSKGSNHMAMGGETTFEDKVKAVKTTLLKNKKVSPKVQKDYGKTYSPKEALASAKRIIGSRVAKYKK